MRIDDVGTAIISRIVMIVESFRRYTFLLFRMAGQTTFCPSLPQRVQNYNSKKDSRKIRKSVQKFAVFIIMIM
jgi:hypothetical protein